MKNRLLLFLSLLFLLPQSLLSQEYLHSLYEKKYQNRLKRADVVGMSMGLIVDGEIRHKQNFGYEDKENGINASSKTQYKIGSISKVFTALALLKLQEEGKVDINNSILQYIPELAIKSSFNEENTLLIKDILSHSSGLPSDMFNGLFSKEPQDFEWTLHKVNQQFMASYPKYEFSYSNLGYGFLGELISRISGETYVDYMRKEVFEPLGLNDTYVFNGEETLSKAYIKKKLYEPDMIRDKAAGSVVSTVDDMLKFLLFFINEGKSNGKQFLSKESMSLLEVNFLEGNVVESPFNYSLGLFIHPCKILEGSLSESDTLIEHGGDTNAFHASFGYLKHKKLGAVLLTNSKNGGRVNNVITLMNHYLEETEYKELELINKEPEEIILSQNNPLSDEEMSGTYAIANFLVDIDNSTKIKTKIAGQKIVLTKTDEANTFKIKAMLLGFIPIKIKEAKLVFFKKDQKIYVSRMNVENRRHQIVGFKTGKFEFNSSWNKYLGEYKAVDAIESNFKELAFKGSCILSEEDDLLILTFPDGFMIPSVSFVADTEQMAYSTGLGRNTGYSLTILENGNLSFMGYELQKVNN